MIKYIAFITMLCSIANAQEPTIVYGASELPDHQKDSYMVVQPENAPNPLGNPIVLPPKSNQPQTIPVSTQPKEDISKQKPTNILYQVSEQNPPPFYETPKEQNNQIDNSLYLNGNRIYDIQSYPVKDINEITKPSMHPIITNYPSY